MKPTRGFTLLEALVALAILAIGLSAGIRSVSIAAQSITEVRERQLAQWVAENRMAQIRLQGIFPDPGAEEGEEEQCKQVFHWKTETSGTPNPYFRRVEITVYGISKGKPLVQLFGFAVKPLR